MRFRGFLRGLVVSCAVMSCAQAAEPPGPLSIEHVTVLPMTPDGAVLRDQTVVIDKGRIQWIGNAATAPQPAGPAPQKIDGRGKFLLPGFTDMHMHLENDRLMRLYSGNDAVPDGYIDLENALLPYLANGVTQMFNLSAMSESIGQSVLVESGRALGPHIAGAAMIDGSPPIWFPGMTRVAATPDDGRQAVRDAKAEGYRFIKTYSKLTPEAFLAIVDEARKNGMRVLGHIPGRESGRTADFFVPGFDLVAHAEEFAQQTQVPALDRIPEYVRMMKANGTSLIATLTLNERLLEQTRNPDSLKSRAELLHLDPGMYQMVMHANPYLRDTSAERVAFLQSLVTFNRELVRACAAAGVPVLTGTDSPVPGIVPGFSLHDEFEALVRAGLSPREVLAGSTRRAAEWLGTAADRGTVEVGKRADLVLLDANPLESIANTRRITAVMVNGRHRDRGWLDVQMKALAIRNRPQAD